MVTGRGRAGFTLVEAMLAVAIIGVLASTAAYLFIQVNRYFIMTKARTALQGEARSVMYVLTRELRQAQSSTISISRASSAQPYYSKITFTTQEGVTKTFLQDGSSLVMQWDGHSRTLTSDLRYLAFTFPRSDDMTILSVAMTLETAIYQGQTKALHMASEKVQIMN